jgi:membrane-anchored protein YejM (alkaline phosphatase superfamily)
VVVIVSADHGEEIAQHRFHGHVLNDRIMRVPYMVSLPGVAAGRSSVPVSSLDTFPTVLSLTQTAVPPGLDGKDLTTVFAGGSMPPRVVLGDAWVVDMANNLSANLVVATDGHRAYTSNLRTGAADLLQLDDERSGRRGQNLLERAAPCALRVALERYLEAQGSDPRAL